MHLVSPVVPPITAFRPLKKRKILPQIGSNEATYFLSFATSPKGAVCLPFRSELWRGIGSRGSELSSGFVAATPQVRGCLEGADSVLVRRKMC